MNKPTRPTYEQIKAAQDYFKAIQPLIVEGSTVVIGNIILRYTNGEWVELKEKDGDEI